MATIVHGDCIQSQKDESKCQKKVFFILVFMFGGRKIRQESEVWLLIAFVVFDLIN